MTEMLQHATRNTFGKKKWKKIVSAKTQKISRRIKRKV